MAHLATAAFPFLLTLAALADARGTTLYAGGSWAAIDRGNLCEAASRSVLRAPKGKAQALAGFAFTPDRKRWGEFSARLGRTPRPGSTILLAVGRQSFLLVSRGDWAWSRGPVQEQAIIVAARSADMMRIEARDRSGRRFADTYSLRGAPAAIDAAAAACAGKIAPR